MKFVFQLSALAGLTLLWGLGCETGESLESSTSEEDFADDESEELTERAVAVGVFQAEAFTSQSGCAVATNHTGYTGSGFVDYGGNGTWIELNNVNAPVAGSHTLTFRYAAASGSRQCAIVVNGTSVGNLAFASTGAWTTWGTVSITTSLKAGNNTIRLQANTSSGGPNLDNMAVMSNVPTTGAITHVATTVVYDSDGQNLSIARPSGSKAGDLLILALHRTDDDLPLFVNGWTRVAECYKRDNGYDCSTEDDCTTWHNSNFCQTFGDAGREGHDLAQSIFYKAVGSSEPGSYQFNLNRDSTGHPGWAILTALRGAATTNPIRDWDNEGCDNNPDSLFPSVYGVKGDMVLLSQSYDDAIAQANFGAPTGTSTLGYVSKSDEAGFLYGGLVSATGQTGAMKSHGDGGSTCKDGLVSLTIKPN